MNEYEKANLMPSEEWEEIYAYRKEEPSRCLFTLCMFLILLGALLVGLL